MKQLLVRCGSVLVGLAFVGFLAAWAGLIPISASSGHWPITAWFLHFTMRQSVQTHTLGSQEPPPLDDPALVLKGAKHYATGCAPCHGAPGMPASKIAQQMTPHPPDLQTRVPEWEPDELFWIVKHGIKFTGMPAWPTQHRDDEVWAVVGFLRRLPQLTPDDYAEITEKPTGGARLRTLSEPVRSTVENCARCHGTEGTGIGSGAFPRLADQSRVYLEAALKAFAEGERHSGIMQPIAAGLSEEERRQIADYYARQPAPLPPPEERLPGSPQRGRQIARRGIPAKGVPSCVHCHGLTSPPRNPYYPKLAGQYADYLILQLELFKKGHRGGTPFAPIMHESVDRMTQEQIRDLAAYYAALRTENR